MRERWIKIGSVKSNHFVFEMSHGSPDGFLMAWQGRTDWCQPFEFREWDGLLWAVKRRCELARLEAVTFACRLPTSERGFRWAIYDLLVLVKRKMNTDTLKLKFLAATEYARLYEEPMSHKQQWVPRSVCIHVEKPAETETRGDMHEVKIAKWWLEQNPFKAKAGDQASLF